jgi:hypothetical protein
VNWKKYGSGIGIIYNTTLEFVGGTERKTKGVSQSAVSRIARFSNKGQNPDRLSQFAIGSDEIFCSPKRPDRLWGLSSLMCNGYRVFSPGVKRPEREVDHLPPSSVEVNMPSWREQGQLYVCEG